MNDKKSGAKTRSVGGRKRKETGTGSDDGGQRSIEARWGKVIARPGWTAVPNIFLDKLHALGLKPREAIILILLMRYWYTADKPPFPSKRKLASSLGVDERTIQRATSELEKLKLLQKRQRRLPQSGGPDRLGSNTYTLDGLRKMLEPYAREANEERERHEAAQETIKNRKRPRKESL